MECLEGYEKEMYNRFKTCVILCEVQEFATKNKWFKNFCLKFASVEDFWLLFKRLRKMNYLYSFRWELNLIVLTMDISSAD